MSILAVASSNGIRVSGGASGAGGGNGSSEAFFEDDFESGDLSAWDGFSGGTILVDQTQPRAGTYSAHVELSSASQNDNYQEHPFGDHPGTTGDGTAVDEVWWHGYIRYSADTNLANLWDGDSTKVALLNFEDDNGDRQYQVYLLVDSSGVIQCDQADWTSGSFVGSRVSANLRSAVSVTEDTWHEIKLRVVANTPGSSDGIVEYWIDQQKIASHTDLDLRGSSSYTPNQLILSSYMADANGSDSGDVWYDDWALAETDQWDYNNPDNVTVASTTYVWRDYETENSSHVNAGDNAMWLFDHGAYGYNGTNAWRGVLNFAGAGTTEDDAGWTTGANWSADTVDLVVVKRLFYTTAAFYTAMDNGDHYHHKDITGYQWNEAGSGRTSDSAGRWVGYIDRDNGAAADPDHEYNDGGIRFSITAGGAGDEYFRTDPAIGSYTNPDLNDYAGEWVMRIDVLDAANATWRVFLKGENDAQMVKVLENQGAVVSNPDSLADLGHGWYEVSWLMGYIDNINTGRANDTDIQWIFDGLWIGNGWPPSEYMEF